MSECYEKLSEHFDAFVIVTNVEEEGHNPSNASHYGGFHTAIGLLADALNAYTTRQLGDKAD